MGFEGEFTNFRITINNHNNKAKKWRQASCLKQDEAREIQRKKLQRHLLFSESTGDKERVRYERLGIWLK